MRARRRHFKDGLVRPKSKRMATAAVSDKGGGGGGLFRARTCGHLAGAKHRERAQKPTGQAFQRRRTLIKRSLKKKRSDNKWNADGH